MGTAAIAAIAFAGGLFLATMGFLVLWWLFRKTLGLVKLIVGWAVTVTLLAVLVAVIWLLLSMA